MSEFVFGSSVAVGGGFYFGGLGTGAPGIDYSLNSLDPELVADFPNAYHRSGGAPTNFADLFTHSRISTAKYTDSNGHHQTAAIGEARVLDHVFNGTSWVPAGMLIEPAATNTITNSEDLTGWGGANRTLTADQAIGPDGALSLTKLEGSGGGVGVSYIRALPSVAASSVHVSSVYVRAGSGHWFAMGIRNFTTPANSSTIFNPNNGTVVREGDGHTAGVDDLGGGLYRCWVRFTTGTDTSGEIRYQLWATSDHWDVPLDGTAYLYMGQPQLEAAQYPSSYIPTAGATVTRAADTLSIAAAKVPWSSTGLSYAIEGDLSYHDADDANQIELMAQDIDNSNRILLQLATNSTRTGSIYGYHRVGGTVDQVLLDAAQYTPGADVGFEAALRLTDSEMNVAGNGAVSIANATLPSLVDVSATDLEVGSKGFSGHIKTLRVWGADIGDAGLTEFVS